MDSPFKPSQAIIAKFELDTTIQKLMQEACDQLRQAFNCTIEARLSHRLYQIEGREVTREDVEEHGGVVLEKMAEQWWRRYRWKGKLVLSVSGPIWQWSPFIKQDQFGEYSLGRHTWLIVDESEE